MKNSVILLGYYGGDNRHCLSAWQSTNVELGVELSPNIKERIEQLYDATVIQKKKTPQELLNFLASSGHTSPFRKSHLDFQLTADLASHIHCLKHTVGVEINSESARYKELTDKWHIPDDWVNLEVKNWGLNMFRVFDHIPCPTWGDILYGYSRLGHALYHEAINQLSGYLGRARAKESARYFLPYAKQLDFDMQFSFQAFVHFQKLRNSDHAQKEIKQIADYMLDEVKSIPNNPFKYSLEAFGL